MAYAIGIDSGTQGTKALIVDFSGRALGRGHAKHTLIPDLPPGFSEQDPSSWITAMETAVAAALKESGIDPRQVVCLGVSGQQHGFVALDASRAPIRPAKLWNDTSTAAETEEIVARLGGSEAMIKKMGISLAVGFTASKIFWLKKHEPKNWSRLAMVLLPHDYLNFHLTGVCRMEYGDASGTGLLDIRRQRWHPKALAVIDSELIHKLPPLVHPQEPLGMMRPEVAGRFGFGDVLISAGGGDNMMAAIGTGNVKPGIVTLSLGTSGTIYSYSSRPLVDPKGEIASFCDSSGGWLPLLCTMNVTNSSECLKELLHLDNSELERAAAACPAGSEGVLFLPYLDGERVPALPEACGVLFGLTRRTFTAGHLSRAVLEGALLNLGYGMERLRTLGLPIGQIRATGGGARSGTWLQMAADILGAPVVTLKEEEAAALGAALQAIWCYRRQQGEELTLEQVTSAAVHLGTLAFTPDPERASLYLELRREFNSLRRTLAGSFHRSRLLQGKLQKKRLASPEG